jgi:undecaprenyl-diphosphatase
MDFIFALLLGVVEGITEFLPISSTGHLLIASALFQFPTFVTDVGDKKAFRDTFDIFIQLGAVIAVLLYFNRDLIKQLRLLPSDNKTQRFWLNVLIAFIPAGIIGFLFRKPIQMYLFNPLTIGIALIIGGIIFLLVERKERAVEVHELENVTPRQALIIGVAQITSLIPGVSRSGASIVGGMLSGLDRRIATTFSFYLALPTLGAATFYQLFSAIKDNEIQFAQWPLFAAGTATAFIVAYAAIAWLLHHISHNSFRAFGIYRIIAGLIIVGLALFTSVLSH